MTKHPFRFIFFLLVCFILPLAAKAQTVTIPDPNLRAAIEKTLDKASGAPITASEMATLTGLEAKNANISDLTGLEGATKLTRLDLGDNAITDISVLVGLANLTDISLDFNNITDISVLSGLTKLIGLDLGYNAIIDHSIVSGLTNLTRLDLRSTNTSDLSVLSDLTKLERLYIDSNRISDLSPLAGLTELRSLGLNGNSISDLSPLKGLTNLSWMRLASNNITDLSPLVANTGLGKGDWVDVTENPLSHTSIKTHIPTLQIREVTVEFDPPAPPAPFENIPFDINNIPEPAPPPAAVRDFFELDPFYQQWINVEGFPVVASEKVNPYALKEAAWLIWQMIGHRPDVLQALVQNRVRFSVIGYTELRAEIPEYRHYGGGFLVNRARGAGGSLQFGRPAVSSSEENILHYPGGGGLYNVLIHEFAHAIHLLGLPLIDPTFDNRLKSAYDAAIAKGLWYGTYAASDRREYWAEGTQAWFHSKGTGSFDNYGNTRSALKAYDPPLAALLTEIYGDTQWRYTPPVFRLNLPHLQGFNPQDSPTFEGWPELYELERQFRDPNSDGGDNWVDLRPYDPNLLPSLNQSRTAVNLSEGIAFVNLTQARVFVYWVGYDGTPEYWTIVNPGELRVNGGRINDIWLIKDHNRNDLVVFQSKGKLGRAIIGGVPIITPGLSKHAGDNQSGVSGAVLPSPFVVEVRDDNGSALEGISVTFTVTGGDGTLSVTHTTTDANGQAESTLTLGPKRGTTTVEVSATGIEGPVTFNAVAEVPVDIPDPNLRAAIENALGKASGAPITASEMQILTHLEARNVNIGDLTGLELATNLTRLSLGDNAITDISVLARLTNLTELSLDFNNITDISVLAGLTKLTELALGYNDITDHSIVSGLTNLTRLDLRSTNTSDLSVLSGLTKLESLYIDDNGISDLSPLAGLTELRSLGLNFNSISNLSPLRGLTNLSWMRLAGNDISNISPVAGLTNLRQLWLQDNALTDISPVADLTNLKELVLQGNAIADISPLSGLTNLTGLWLAYNTISDISPLVANTGLGSGDRIFVNDNPLNRASIETHIPALQSRGVAVEFDADGTRSPDVNGDGSVDVLDLIVVTSYFGHTGENIATDVSGDGVVNVLDLVLIAGMFQDTAAAPSAQPQVPETLTAVEVQGWLTDARGLEVRDLIVKRGFLVLEQLLVFLTPKETELLANYPNPFNPETWIPYRLAEDAVVTLTIYDPSGRVVRTLDVGRRIAAAYESRSKAIYWDGRNALGEEVASGVYFYHLSAGDYSATRRMGILK